MPNLGSAKYTLVVAGDKFRAGMTQAKGHAERTTKSIGASFGRAQAKIQATASKVPVVGGALAGLATPAGLATAAIGLVVGSMIKMVSKTLDVGRRLGELREKLGVSAEGIQIYERAIEEGNGNTAAFEKTTLRLQKAIGDAADGNKAATEQFDRLGLSFEDLADKSPEEALRAVLGAANDTLGPTDRASVLAATLGRSYADLGAFATKGSVELGELLDSVKDTAVTMSGDGVTAVDEYDAANRDMRDSFGSIVTEVGMALIPTITQLFGVIKQLMPIIKVVIAVALLPLQLAVTRVSAAVNIVSALLRGDFTGALKHAKNFFIDTATSILKVGAKIVGLFNKDMAKAIEGTIDDLQNLKVETDDVAETLERETVPALDAVATATRKAGEETETTGDAVAAATPKWREQAGVVQTASERLQAYQDRNSKLREEFTMMYPELVKVNNEIERNAEETETAITWLMLYEARLLGARQEADMFALSLGKIRTGYSNLPPAGGTGSSTPSGLTAGQTAGGGFQTPSGKDLHLDSAGNAFYNEGLTQPVGDDLQKNISSQLDTDGDGISDAEESAAQGAQYGAFVRGSRMGSLVRVGENNTDEHIIPSSRMNGGNGAGSGQQPLVIPVSLGGETLATIYVEGKRVAVREGRD